MRRGFMFLTSFFQSWRLNNLMRLLTVLFKGLHSAAVDRGRFNTYLFYEGGVILQDIFTIITIDFV